MVIDSRVNIIQLGPDVRGHVYVKVDGVWQLTPDKVLLPEGWFAGPFIPKGK